MDKLRKILIRKRNTQLPNWVHLNLGQVSPRIKKVKWKKSRAQAKAQRPRKTGWRKYQIHQVLQTQY